MEEHEMESRYLPNPQAFERMNTHELRTQFLVSHLFQRDKIRLVYTDLDRIIVGGIVPVSPLILPHLKELGTSFFTERREIGLFNIGGPAKINTDGAAHQLNKHDCLYVGTGCKDIAFESSDPSDPAQLYLLSAPAHASYPARTIARRSALTQHLGDKAHANIRTIYQYIHPEVCPSCQLVMGFTEMEEGSVWNTMPPHTHQRRTEVYMYFDMGSELVVHLMGEPGQIRTILVRDREAVLSPAWSMHSGCGTRSYRFIWGMAGDNQSFGDMDAVNMDDLY
jgi:4-deoxy-L-threo-5-hexosulose-uronate ketol-isomerase